MLLPFNILFMGSELLFSPSNTHSSYTICLGQWFLARFEDTVMHVHHHFTIHLGFYLAKVGNPPPRAEILTTACLIFFLLLTDRPILGLPEYKQKVVNICQMDRTGGLEVVVLPVMSMSFLTDLINYNSVRGGSHTHVATDSVILKLFFRHTHPPKITSCVAS